VQALHGVAAWCNHSVEWLLGAITLWSDCLVQSLHGVAAKCKHSAGCLFCA
jgi:hypothetical protein